MTTQVDWTSSRMVESLSLNQQRRRRVMDTIQKAHTRILSYGISQKKMEEVTLPMRRDQYVQECTTDFNNKR